MLYGILLSYVVPLLHYQGNLGSLSYTCCCSISVLFDQHLCYVLKKLLQVCRNIARFHGTEKWTLSELQFYSVEIENS